MITPSVCQGSSNAMDNARNHKEPSRSPQCEITAGMTVPANAAGDRWKPQDQIHESCWVPGSPTWARWTWLSHFPSQLDPWEAEAVLFSNDGPPWNVLRAFWVTFPTYHSAFKIHRLKWQVCSEQKPPFGCLCPKSSFVFDYNLIRLSSLNEMWKLPFLKYLIEKYFSNIVLQYLY